MFSPLIKCYQDQTIETKIAYKTAVQVALYNIKWWPDNMNVAPQQLLSYEVMTYLAPANARLINQYWHASGS